MPTLHSAESVDQADVTINDEFWNSWLETNREVTLEYQYDHLETSGCLENFRRAAAGDSGGFRGMWFADSDAYKWLEAASYVLASRDDPDLSRRVDAVIDLVAAAQDDDGYLNTYFVLEEPEKRWTNLNMMHELYCAGHLIEAAVAHHRATGDRELLEVATRFADHVESIFGDEIAGVPGHQEIELALVKLARATDEDRYVDLARYFVDLRGHDDRLEREFERIEEIAGYDPETGGIAAGARDAFYEDGAYDGRYAQAHAPLLEQTSVEGHAVRAMYFFAGAADVAAETGDAELLAHLERLWETVTERRTYVTGGIGSSAAGERFTEDYDLPNDTAYAETCAAIGSIFWSQRLFELTGNARYADLIEWTLYNAVLVGMSRDGTEFFYDNRLESDGDHHREGWFECACCPPNVARLLASLEEYLYATGRDDADDPRLYVNQYVSSAATVNVAGTDVDVVQTAGLPWDGEVTLEVDAATPTEFGVSLRIPSWCPDVTVRINDREHALEGDVEGHPGTWNADYVTVTREWDDDRLEIRFEQSVVPVRAHPAVEADAGRIALTRGPLVYCLEGVDNDRPLHQYRLEPELNADARYREDLLGGTVVLEGATSAPALEGWDDDLYLPAAETNRVSASFTAIPHFQWDNREPGEMAVWLHDG
ncbi:glycoside hydrolase family 127 protein [Natronorubrum halophilum]|uniref:glycoside hydrolase family 127 protein n=1 Tax=Natronorubrum halophilum TaxID=1702106 RepID=UPI0010C194D2|nr:beta-L-arabinofuranosidase domain-containing protein [Natronorubrum halophilum]